MFSMMCNSLEAFVVNVNETSENVCYDNISFLSVRDVINSIKFSTIQSVSTYGKWGTLSQRSYTWPTRGFTPWGAPVSLMYFTGKFLYEYSTGNTLFEKPGGR